MASQGLLTGGDKTNRQYVGDDIAISETVDANLVKLLFDPQTAGGMLIAIRADQADRLLERLREHYSNAKVIGRVTEVGTAIDFS